MSDLPENPALQEMFVKMVERYAALWHNGQIPSDIMARLEFIDGILNEYLPYSLRDRTNVCSDTEWLAYRQETATQLAVAVEQYDALWRTGRDCLALERDTRWTN